MLIENGSPLVERLAGELPDGSIANAELGMVKEGEEAKLINALSTITPTRGPDVEVVWQMMMEMQATVPDPIPYRPPDIDGANRQVTPFQRNVLAHPRGLPTCCTLGPNG